MGIKIIFIIFFFRLFASQSAPERLTWAPRDFLKQGYLNAPWVKDPFYPQGDEFKLSAVISDELAYINGKWYSPGEFINGFLVKEIKNNEVILTRRGRIVVLKLGDIPERDIQSEKITPRN